MKIPKTLKELKTRALARPEVKKAYDQLDEEFTFLEVCPNCDATNLVQDTRDLPYTYKGETTTLPQISGSFFLACNEAILDMTESRRTMQLMLSFNRCASLP